MAGAYDAFANGGRRVEPYGVSRIRTPQGRVIYQRSNPETGQAINNPPLYYLNEMLRGVVTSGSGRGAAIAGRDLAGKTGTTSDYKDAWFVGYTGGFVTAVWVGKDDNTAMRGVTGGSSPAAIWRGFMEAALPRLNAPRIPDGPAMPEGWQAPDPVGDLLSNLGDGQGQPVEPVDPSQGQPYVEQDGPPRPQPVPGQPPVVRPNAPQPVQPRQPDQQADGRLAPERRQEPLFY
jgi:penicillin-binding protein 1A